MEKPVIRDDSVDYARDQKHSIEPSRRRVRAQYRV